MSEAVHISGVIATVIERLVKTINDYGLHEQWCSGKPNGVDGDCDCGWILKRQRANEVMNK